MRGGGFNSVAKDCRSAARSKADPSTQQDTVGFRVALVRTSSGDEDQGPTPRGPDEPPATKSLAYQWYKDGTAIAGATAPSLAIQGASANDAGNYTVSVSNFFGSVLSDAAALTVTKPVPSVSFDANGGTTGTSWKASETVEKNANLSALLGQQVPNAPPANVVTPPEHTVFAGYEVKVGDAAATTLAPGDAINVTLSAATSVKYLWVIPITVESASQGWTYDGTAHDNGSVSVTSGVLATGDELVATASGSVTNVADAHAGNNTITECKVMHGDQEVTGNYVITQVAGTLTIGARKATVSVANKNATYDGTEQTGNTTCTFGNLASGHDATITYAPAKGTVASTTPYVGSFDEDTFTVMAGEDNVTANYELETATPGELTISRRPVTFRGQSQTKDYTGAQIEITTVVAEGLVEGHTHNVTFSAKGTEVGGPYTGTITAKADVQIKSGNDVVTPNYDVAVAGGALTIQQNPTMMLSVSLADGSFTYDGKTHWLQAPATTNASTGETTIRYAKEPSEGTPAEDDWTQDLSTLTATDVTDSCAILVRASNPNYANTAEGSARLAIAPKKATITVNNASKVVGQQDPAFSGMVEGLVSDNDLGDIVYVRTNANVENPGVYSDVLTATYESSPNYDVSVKNGDFTIRALLTARWLDGDGSVLQSTNYPEGDSVPTYTGKVPTKAADTQHAYKFDKWDVGTTDGTITTYRPTFSQVANKYKVTFVDEDGKTVLKEATEYDYGTPAANVVRPTDPTKAADAKNTYAFAGWSPAIADVTSDATYKATYKATPKTGTLTFDLAGGTLDGKTDKVTMVANVGDTVTIPNAPTRTGYTFKYWKGSEYHPGDKYTVTGDHTFTAVWEKVTSSTTTGATSTTTKNTTSTTGSTAGTTKATTSSTGSTTGTTSRTGTTTTSGGATTTTTTTKATAATPNTGDASSIAAAMVFVASAASLACAAALCRRHQ